MGAARMRRFFPELPNMLTGPATRPVADIVVGERHRRELGDIDGLARSIAELGLLHADRHHAGRHPDRGRAPPARREAARLDRHPRHRRRSRRHRARRVRRERVPQGFHAVRGRSHQARAGADRAGGGEGAAGKARSGRSGKLAHTFKGRAADKAATGHWHGAAYAREGRGHCRCRRGRAREVRQAARRHGSHRPGEWRLSAAEDCKAGRADLRRAAAVAGAMGPIASRHRPALALRECEAKTHRMRGVRALSDDVARSQISAHCRCASILHEDTILWVWTTNLFMRHAYTVLDAWGFEERTILTWAKDRFGNGDWLRGQTEHASWPFAAGPSSRSRTRARA